MDQKNGWDFSEKLPTLVMSNQKNAFMTPKKDSIDFDSGHYFRLISFYVAIILSGLCLYLLWVETDKDEPNLRKITAMVVFVPLIWGVVLLIRSIFNDASKQKEVEDLFKSIREATKQARETTQKS
jgi:Trk-type K+ transport system membrane component